MPIIIACSGALRALIVGGESVPRVASRSALLTRGYVCLALRAGEDAGTDWSLLVLRAKCNSQKQDRHPLENTHPKRKQCQCNFTEVQLSEVLLTLF